MTESTTTFTADSYVPLRPAIFLILLTLAEGDRHGYAIKKQVEELTGGVLRLGPGTLYETIQRLERRGLIEESPERPDPEHDHSQRRYYRLTTTGRRILEAEVGRLGRVVDYARSRVTPR